MADALNLSWITETLAIGGRIADPALEQLFQREGVRAVVDLRREACDDAELLARHGVAFLHLPTEDLCGVSEPMLGEGVAFVRPWLAAGEKVLIHCEHGIGRSAVLALCVLVDAGMEPLEALELAKARRGKVSPSPAQYQAWVGWLETHRRERAAAWRPPDFHSFGCIAYSHLAEAAR